MSRPTFFIVIGLAVLVFVNGQEDPTAKITDKVNELVSAQGINITELEKGSEDAKKLLKAKCEKNGASPDSFDKIFLAKDNLTACLQDLVNVTVLQEEMRLAGPTGDVDLVFKKYCDKKPLFEKCINSFISTLEPCLEQQEKDNLKIINNVTNSLFDFVCFKEGERLALFISVGGPECFMEKREPIQNCLNSTFGGSIPVPVAGAAPSLDSLPAISFSMTECTHMQNLQKCVVENLEKCKDTTPGNMADSLFKFVRRATPCENILRTRSVNSDPAELAKSGSSGYSLALFLPVVASLVLKFF